MFGTERIPQIQAAIGQLESERAAREAHARALLDQGRRSAAQLPDYHQRRLEQHRTTIAQTIAAIGLEEACGWEAARWRAWEATRIAEAPLIRTGVLVDPRSQNEQIFPSFAPFIGGNATIIIHTKGDAAERGASLLQSLLVRTAVMLPHRAAYTLIDPAGAGRAFPMRRYLAHVRQNSGDVRRDLDGVIADIQRIIEGYLDPTITSFEQVPSFIRVNERFQFVFAADFPHQYDRRAIEALQSIGNTGTVAGVYLFIHYNEDYPLPRDITLDGFSNAFHLDLTGAAPATVYGLNFQPETAPASDQQTALFEALRRAKPPERTLDWQTTVGTPEDAWWQERSDERVSAPVGAQGSNEPLHVWFGVNADGQPCAHGMLGAMTGSGKSNLYHVLITGLAIRYSPEELRFYLIDGKDGVEFQPYRHLPHAEVVSLRSSAELSRSVLAELVEEKERRNTLFTQAGVADFGAYRRKGQPLGALPRVLLLIDEYQQLFEGDRDGVASSYLLQLAQQGRSAGIHMILASQRFGAAGMLNQTGIFGNVHLRMAMQMTSADVQALTEFGRRGKALIATCDLPGKIVINDRSGDDGANAAGKVAFITADQRDQVLERLTARAATLSERALPRRVVFNGQMQPKLIDNPLFDALLQRAAWPQAHDLEQFARRSHHEGGLEVPDWFAAERPSVLWLGQEFNVRGQTQVVLRLRPAEHLLIVGSASAACYGMLAATLASLSVSAAPACARFLIADRSIPGTRWSTVLQTVCESLLRPAGFQTTLARSATDLDAMVAYTLGEIDRRHGLTEDALAEEPTIYVVCTELDRVEGFRRRVGSYGLTDSPRSEQLARLYVEGAPLGIHVILLFGGARLMASVIDERRGLLHFRHRVALQMSEDESHMLVRSRKAAQLQSEGARPVCALYLDVEHDRTVRFKPYSCDLDGVPADESLEAQLRAIGATLHERSSSNGNGRAVRADAVLPERAHSVQ